MVQIPTHLSDWVGPLKKDLTRAGGEEGGEEAVGGSGRLNLSYSRRF